MIPKRQAHTLVYRVLKSLTSLKLSLFASRNFDFGTGARIAAGCGRTFGNGKCTETNQTNFVARLQSIGNRSDECVNSFGRISFG